MQRPRIHIISFQRPYPPTYGGVIDMYYKIKACHELGLYVILHTFHYNDRAEQADKLNEIADEVHYYHRKTSWKMQLSIMPYIVKSRRNTSLLANLIKDDAPILFEGLHTCGFLNHPQLKERIKIVRAHNIEHNYYKALAMSPGKIVDRLYYYLESLKLKRFEKILTNANIIASLNLCEAEHFSKMYPNTEVIFSPVFFNEQRPPVSACSDYVLYHGNLLVEENVKSALWIIQNVASQIPNVKFVIAGYNPPSKIKTLAAQYANITLHDSPTDEEMESLIEKAKLHLLITFQATGVKLKLLHVLQRHGKVLSNSKMIEGTGLDNYCMVANTPTEIIAKIQSFYTTNVELKPLPDIYNSRNNIKNLLSHIDYYKNRI